MNLKDPSAVKIYPKYYAYYCIETCSQLYVVEKDVRKGM